MTQGYWPGPHYTTPGGNDCGVPETGNAFSNALDNINHGYENSSISPNDIRGDASSRMQTLRASQAPSTELAHRISPTGLSPTDASFSHINNTGNSIYTATSSPNFISGSPNPLFPPFHPAATLYASNSNVSYNLAHPGSSHHALQTTTNYPTTFTQTSIDYRNRYPTSVHSTSGMPPPMRNIGFNTSTSPINAPLRTDYTSNSYSSRPLQSNVDPFQLIQPPSPPLSLQSRGGGSVVDRTSPSSSSTYGYGSNFLHLEAPIMGASSRDAPPFEITQPFLTLIDAAGNNVYAEIHANIDKGFFKADTDWCCYRRNYFSVACSYKLNYYPPESKPTPEQLGLVNHEQVRLMKDHRRERILGFYLSIGAEVDGEDRGIDLVQHTPKRDKGPMTRPEKKQVKPNLSGNVHSYSTGGGFGTQQHSFGSDALGDHYNLGTTQEIPTVANFERIQFKKATANNGKRRAAQQYFRVVIGLHAEIQKASGPDFIKLAHRVSAPMVVRGRSPGHYQDGSRTSNNMGGGTGAGGGYGGTTRDTGYPGMAPHPSYAGGHYPHRSGSHSGFHGAQHNGAGYELAPIPSLPVSGIFNQAFAESVTGPEITMSPSPLAGIEQHSDFAHYFHNERRDNPAWFSRPTTAQTSRNSAESTPSSYETPSSFLNRSPVKEERLKHVRTLEHRARNSSCTTLQSLVTDTWSRNKEISATPAASTTEITKECRPVWHSEVQKSFYPTMPTR